MVKGVPSTRRANHSAFQGTMPIEVSEMSHWGCLTSGTGIAGAPLDTVATSWTRGERFGIQRFLFLALLVGF